MNYVPSLADAPVHLPAHAQVQIPATTTRETTCTPPARTLEVHPLAPMTGAHVATAGARVAADEMISTK
jgi:hypothetical protein